MQLKKVVQTIDLKLNIASGKGNCFSSVKSFQELKWIPWGRLKCIPDDSQSGNQRFFVAHNMKIQAATEWVPQVTRAEGVAKTLEWIQEVKIHDMRNHGMAG